jgi:pimeloyl-ACP methyl ester carboxylesterase
LGVTVVSSRRQEDADSAAGGAGSHRNEGGAVERINARTFTVREYLCALAISISFAVNVWAAEDLGQEGYANSAGVKIHYVTSGEGPLIVLIHGFPDYWYSWRAQIPELSKRFQVVAIDQRGYNKSDQPSGVDNYKMEKLVGDVRAVVKHFGKEKAIIGGHDWGGAVAWAFAMMHPEMTERLIVLNLPHPNGIARELANNPQQQANSAYARAFQQEGAHKSLSPKALAGFVGDDQTRDQYIAAFERSSIEGMLNYYKANYPREPYPQPQADPPKVKCPVLLIHGLKDKALLAAGLNNTWEWVDNELTIVTIPNADHFVHHDAPDRVNQIMLRWLP